VSPIASGVELATAYIQLIPSLRGAQREIQRQLGPVGDRAGQQFGQDFNDSATSEMEGRGGIGGVAQKAGGFGADFGKKFGAAAALAIGAAVGASIVSAINQEVEIDRVSAALGATPKEAERLGALAGQLYGDNFGDSVGGVATAIESVRSSFRSLGTGDDLRKVTEQALNFADIFEIDLPRAVSVAQTVVRAGLAKNASRALDLLTAAAQRVPAALREDILDAANEYGQFFKQVGFGGEQTFTALVDNAKLGEFGIDKAGDAIKEFTIRSTDMSTASVAAYKTIGLNASTMANDILKGGKTAGDATQKIVDGLLGIKDPATQANTAIALFGTPIEDLGVKNIPAFLKSLKAGEKGLGNFRGAIDRAGTTANDNASRNIEAFKRQVTQTFVDLIGKKVLPYITDFAAVLTENLSPVVTKVRAGLAKANPILEKVGDFLKKNREYVKAFAIGLGVVAVAMGAVTLATTAFSIALNTTGIPLVIIGIAALVAGLYIAYRRSVQFRAIVDQVGQATVRFGAYLRDVVIPAVAKFATDVGTRLKPVFDQLVQTFVTRVMPTLTKVFAKIREASPAIGQIITFIARWIGTLVRLYATVVGKVLPVILRLAGFLFSKIIPAFAAVTSGAIRVVGVIARVGNAVLAAAQKFRSFATGVGDSVDLVVNVVTNAVGGLPAKIIGCVGEMKSAGSEFIGGLFAGIRSAASGAGGLLGDIASSVGDAFRGVINDLIGQLNDAIPNKLGKGKFSINLDNNPIPYLAKGTSNFGGGFAIVGEQGPELVTMPRGSRVDTAAATRRMASKPSALATSGGGGGGTMVLRVGDREFVGYVEQIADGRIDVSDDMTTERSRATWSRSPR
jgi:phage-related protein